MKNLFFISTILLTTLNAHECKYTLELDLDMQKGLVQGISTITSDHPSLKLLDSKANIEIIKNASLNISNNTPSLLVEDIHKPVEISFTHKFQPLNGDAILLESWYPKIDIMCKYETIIKNSDYLTIVEATKIEKESDITRYIFDYPLNSLHLVSSKNYTKNSMQSQNGMELSTYLYPSDSHLSNKYFQKSEEYFTMYKDIFGFLPFNNFSVVETPFPAGYSMPTYTLIGKQIIDKDFVLNNSLGHEIAHQWFGNYVYSPYQGNWVEGITTFYADYLYAKKDNRASQYRKDILIKYNSYVNLNNEIALIEFQQKAKESKNAVGYGKSAFFFYMLEQKIGEKDFNKGIKLLLERYPFKVASYKNLREIFEEASGDKLLEFFKTWVYKKGALDFNVQNIKLMYEKNRYVLEFDVVNNLNSGFLPISVCSDDECLSTKIDLTQVKQRLELDIEPRKIVIDENYKVFRNLDVKEIPPVISKIIEGNVLVVVDKNNEKKFSKLMKVFKNYKYSDEVTYDELKKNNILVLGSNNALLKQLAIPFKMQGDTKIELFKNPMNENGVVAVFEMKQLSRSIFYKLKHLGKYSTVVYKDGTIVEKSTKKSLQGVTYILNNGSLALKPEAKQLSSMLEEIAQSKIVFVGERHTEFSSHLNQLKIIKAMYKKDENLAIGMEMFQKPYQKYLNNFIAGKITEKEMIIKTEYFKRWKYDYELYRPIILFAKEKQIPLVALNIDREITKKVVSQGLDSLSDEQKSQIPKSIDFSNEEYKAQLKMIYGMHQSYGFNSFEEFYHAQLIWDESMAINIVNFIDKNPKYNMTVIAGNGHVMYGNGIPSRINRRGITDYATVLNMTNPEPGIADYLLYPSTITTTKAKKIGVYLGDGKTLTVNKLVEKSVASKAEIKVGDTIIAFNSTPVKNLFDLKTELALCDEKAKLTILRDSKEIELTIDFSGVN